jgi:hypothetical protein
MKRIQSISIRYIEDEHLLFAEALVEVNDGKETIVNAIQGGGFYEVYCFDDDVQEKAKESIKRLSFILTEFGYNKDEIENATDDSLPKEFTNTGRE